MESVWKWGSLNTIKVMLDLPYETHRSLIEPLTEEKHVKLVLIKRFLGFMDKIRKSDKLALKMLQLEAIWDVQSVTGSNKRDLNLLLNVLNVLFVSPSSLIKKCSESQDLTPD